MLENLIALRLWKPEQRQYIGLDQQCRLTIYDDIHGRVIQQLPLPPLDTSKDLALHVSENYVCVVETYGLHALLVHIPSEQISRLSREDYQSKHSRYSIAFLRLDNRPCLLHQTQWNRLDILCLETGVNLTERTIRVEETGQQSDRNGNSYPVYRYENYLDYFHSGLLVSPDDRYFLSNGWVWGPADRIYGFTTAEFLTQYENCALHLQPKLANYLCSGYNWDRPYVFINTTTVLVAVDSPILEYVDPEDDEANAVPYQQFALYQLDQPPTINVAHRPQYSLNASHSFHADVFPLIHYEEVKGELYFDAERQLCIALYEQGMKIFDLEGLIHFSTQTLYARPSMRTSDTPTLGYTYDPVARIFYTFDCAQQRIESIALDDIYPAVCAHRE